MSQLQLLILLALRMEIYPANTTLSLVEADIVEALKARAGYTFDAMIRDQEVFFPAHEEMVACEMVFECEGGRVGLCGPREGTPGGKARPVLEVDLLGGIPGRVRGPEEMFGADDFAFEECGQSRMVIGQA